MCKLDFPPGNGQGAAELKHLVLSKQNAKKFTPA